MDPVFAIRGLLSFVSFTEFTNALRMFVPHAEEKGNELFAGIKLEYAAERTLCHAYGLLSILVGLVIIQAAFFAHYRPLVTLALSAELIKVIFLLAETFIFGSILVGQHLIFPVVTGVVTILATAALLFLTAESDLSADSDENGELVKKSRRLRKNK